MDAVKTLAIVCFVTLALVHAQKNCFEKVRYPQEPEECDAGTRYRTLSGRCNNVEHPEWGTSGMPFARLVPNAYADGKGEPRGGRHPSALPNARWISQKNHNDADVPDPRFTHIVMQFGQFLDHDLTLTPKQEDLNCCHSEVQGPDCFPIAVPSSDRFYSWVNNSVQCLNLVRSKPFCGTSAREQVNVLTSYVDASTVYGSDPTHAALLRTLRDGRLERNASTDMLPTREQLGLHPKTNQLRPEKHEDFMAGEMRVNEHPFLTTMHVVFVREHNRIVKLLKEYLPERLHEDEVLYQEARRILIGEMQNIVYGEFLPTILGADFMGRYDLIVAEESSYDPSVDATVFNAFGAAAFRFGHSLINGMFKLVSQRESKEQKSVYWLWRLRELFDGQTIRGAKLPLESMIEGLITQAAQKCDQHITTEVTDHLFQKNGERQNFGEDLLSLNIQRGRDHGIPGYSQYRKFCGLRELTDWDNRPTEHSEAYWLQLKDVYESVHDIDLFVGAIAEINLPGAVLGPTFACLIGEQFNRLKRGDRYFFTHTSASGGRGLGPVAKAEVVQRTLGDVLCDNTQLQKVQKWVTLQPNANYNDFELCANKRRMDLRAIAQEIASELEEEDESSNLRLVSAGPASLNTLLRSSSPVQFNAVDAVTRPLPQEGESRVPKDFSFPPEVAAVSQIATAQQEQPQEAAPSRQAQDSTPGVSSNACLFNLCLNSGYGK